MVASLFLDKSGDGGLLLMLRCLFMVENRRRVRFWKDMWCRQEPLCISFPLLFAITDSKDA